MDHKIAAFTFFTFFFFTVSAARLTVDTPASNPSAVVSENASKIANISRESLASAGSNILLPTEKLKSETDETTANNPLQGPEKPANNSTQRTNFSRFHPINRHFRGKPPRGTKHGSHRRPCRNSVTQSRISEIKDEIASRRTDNSNPENFPGEVPTNLLKVKDHHGSRRHHNQRFNNNVNDDMRPKHVFDREKLKSLIREHKEKKREEETGFMKNIRKFLKHTFD